jgi:hypothetical protein
MVSAPFPRSHEDDHAVDIRKNGAQKKTAATAKIASAHFSFFVFFFLFLFFLFFLFL